LIVLIVLVLGPLGAPDASADAAAVFVLGASTGGNITVLDDPNFSLETAFENSPLFGFRVGSYGFPFGVEGSLVYSPASLTGEALGGLVGIDTNVLYTEANILLIPVPGPISPFATVGAGMHRLDFTVADFVSFDRTKFGYNFGGGIKADVGKVALRFDVRDHVTTFGLGDFGLGIIGNLIGLSETDARIHNVEISFGAGIVF
jgi:opacity protein-like surface antigen